MIELANSLDRLLQLLKICDRPTDLSDPFATHAELLHAAASVGHRQHEHPMPLSARISAALTVADQTLQQ